MSYLAITLAISLVSQGPTVQFYQGRHFAVSDDGMWAAQGFIDHLWRVKDWRDFGENRTFVLFDPGRNQFLAADYSQSTYLFRGIRGLESDEDTVHYTIHSEKLWGSLHDLVVAFGSSIPPLATQLVSFIFRERRGLHLNKEYLLKSGSITSWNQSSLAFDSRNALLVAILVRVPSDFDCTLRGWKVSSDGLIRKRYSIPFSRKGRHYDVDQNAGVAFTVDGGVFVTSVAPTRLTYHRGTDGRKIQFSVPGNRSAERIIASRLDAFVLSKGETLKYDFATRRWTTINGLEIVAVSGNGKYGLFVNLSNQRLVVRKI